MRTQSQAISKWPTSLAVALAALVFAGCAERQAQRAVQVAMTSLAHGLDATDQVISERWPHAAALAREQVIREREADPAMTVEFGMNRYDQLMANWNLVLTVMRSVRSSLYVGQAAMDSWLSVGELPRTWEDFCSSIGELIGTLVALLDTLDVERPEPLSSAQVFAGEACTLARPWVERLGPGGPGEERAEQ